MSTDEQLDHLVTILGVEEFAPDVWSTDCGVMVVSTADGYTVDYSRVDPEMPSRHHDTALSALLAVATFEGGRS